MLVGTNWNIIRTQYKEERPGNDINENFTAAGSRFGIFPMRLRLGRFQFINIAPIDIEAREARYKFPVAG